MNIRLIYRVLDKQGALLGWTTGVATALGDAKLRTVDSVSIPVDAAGDAVEISVHWPDVNVEVRIPLPQVVSLKAGETLTCFRGGEVVLSLGSMPTNLPGVTVKSSVTVSVPPGGMGLVGMR